MIDAQPAKYLHRFPINRPGMATRLLIDEALLLLEKHGPDGYVLTRFEWHRTDDELTVLCDARPEVQWVRRGLIWRGTADESEGVRHAS